VVVLGPGWGDEVVAKWWWCGGFVVVLGPGWGDEVVAKWWWCGGFVVVSGPRWGVASPVLQLPPERRSQQPVRQALAWPERRRLFFNSHSSPLNADPNIALFKTASSSSFCW